MAQPLWCLSSNASGFRLLDLRRGWCAFVHSDDDHVRLLDLRRGWCAFVHSDDDHVRLLGCSLIALFEVEEESCHLRIPATIISAMCY
jgi:hypothetical protein